MGVGDDMKKALGQATRDWTKQRKTEERHRGAVRYRAARLARARDIYVKEAVYQVLEQCYPKVSDDDKLPANVRQLYYAARPLVAAMTDRPLEYGYFSQTLVPDYLANCASNWDVVYDDRGHLTEPHTGLVVGLGTLNVRTYLANTCALKLRRVKLKSAGVNLYLYGPHGQFGALLYIEKEGFMPLFERVELAQRRGIPARNVAHHRSVLHYRCPPPIHRPFPCRLVKRFNVLAV